MLSAGAIDMALRAAARPVLALSRLDERVFLGYLLSAALIAVTIWTLKVRGRSSLLRFLFPSRIWLHRSALFDLRLMVARALLSAFVFGSLFVSSVQVALYAKKTLADLFGAGILTGNPKTALLLITCSAFVAEDFARYWSHRIVHQVPELWALHKVHHSAEVLTPFTIYRSHPLDSLLLRTSAMGALGLGAGISAWILDARLSFIEIGGVHALSVIWNICGSNLRHSHIWLSYPRWLQGVLVSPAQHQIHHSIEARHHNKNFGSVFAIWDHMFGSLYQTKTRIALEFGVRKEELNHHDRVLSSFVSPVTDSFRILRSRFFPPKFRS